MCFAKRNYSHAHTHTDAIIYKFIVGKFKLNNWSDFNWIFKTLGLNLCEGSADIEQIKGYCNL